MTAKIALYIVGGILLISGLFQFLNIMQLQQLKGGFLGQAIDEMIHQKITLGIILSLVGGLMLIIGYEIKGTPPNKDQ